MCNHFFPLILLHILNQSHKQKNLLLFHAIVYQLLVNYTNKEKGWRNKWQNVTRGRGQKRPFYEWHIFWMTLFWNFNMKLNFENVAFFYENSLFLTKHRLINTGLFTNKSKLKFTYIWDKAFKNGPSKICWRQPLKKFGVTAFETCKFIEKRL